MREEKVVADGNKVTSDGNTMVLQKMTAGTVNAPSLPEGQSSMPR